MGSGRVLSVGRRSRVGSAPTADSSAAGVTGTPIIVRFCDGIGGGAAAPGRVMRAMALAPVVGSSKRSTAWPGRAPRSVGGRPPGGRTSAPIGAVVRFSDVATSSKVAPTAGTPGDDGMRLGLRDRMRSSAEAWSAAPTATASSGLTSVRGVRWKNWVTRSRTYGILVVPPTRTTSSIALGASWARRIASSHTANERSMMGWARAMSWSREISISRLIGAPPGP